MDTVNVLDKGYVRLVDTMGSDLSVVNAARVSYDKESDELDNRDKGLISFLYNGDHTSPFRHATLCFEVYAPLFVARQWWKYAVASSHIDDQNGWNESSRRYVTEMPEFHLPALTEWRSAPENSKQGSGPAMESTIGSFWSRELESYVSTGEALYQSAMLEGIAPEQARLFLPAYGMYVRWRWTTSLQGVVHFLNQRLEEDAQVEIQQYAQAVLEVSRPKFPVVFDVAFKNRGQHD